jgi:hypothetical protein
VNPSKPKVEFDVTRIDVIRRLSNITILVPTKSNGIAQYFKLELGDDEAQILAEKIFTVLGWIKVDNNEPSEGETLPNTVVS